VAGTLLAARLSDTAAAGFALANQISAALFIVFRIVGAGIGVVVTQALGSGRPQAAAALARAALGAAGWTGGACAAATALLAGPLLQLMQVPADVHPLALPFLLLSAPVLLLDAWNAALGSVVRAYLHAKAALAVTVLMHGTHLLLAVLLMGGGGPLPALGLAGYALALIASRLLGLALNLHLWRQRLAIAPRLADSWRLPRAEVAAMLHIGLPGAAENMAWRLAYMVSVAVAASLGTQALATHTYVQQLVHLVLLCGLAIGLSVEIVVGHLIGAGRLHEAFALVRRAQALGFACSLLLALAAALAGPWLIGRFTSDPGIVAAGAVLLWWTVLLEPGRTFNLVVINALRAAGDARYPVLAGAGSMAVVLAGGSWWLGVQMGLGLVGVWIAYAADEWIRGLLMWRRWLRLGWVPQARAAHRRLRAVGAGSP